MNLERYFNYQNGSVTYGLTNELIAFFVEGLYNKTNDNIIVLTSNLYESNKIFNVLTNHLENVCLFPMDDFLTSKVVAMSPEFELGRLNTLEKIKKDRQVIVTNLMGYLKFLQPKEVNNTIIVKKNSQIIYKDLVYKLDSFGYHKESLVTMSGEYSTRGFILDLYPINRSHPVRIEFFDNEIESIREFDENTQRTINELNEITISNFKELLTDEYNSLYDYTNNGMVVYYNYNQIKAAYEKLYEDIRIYNEKNDINEKHLYELDDINPQFELYIDNINNNDDLLIQEMSQFQENFDYLKETVDKWLTKGLDIYFFLDNDNQIKKIRELIKDANIIKKKISQGFIIDKIACISANDIGIHSSTSGKYKNSLHIGKKVKSYKSLERGDYVVHINHGIGVYNGLVTLKNKDLTKDYLLINYAGNDKVYIPVEKIETIYKYSSKDGVSPKLNKLNSVNWAKTKEYAKKKAQDISKELLELYTKRASIKKDPYKSYVDEEVFAARFQYEPTKDQLKAVKEINSDLESTTPMDRLLCGDVGFGKTEVAMRAIFKAVINNKQVMYLCPTTILSNQQYNVIKNRFADIPIEIRLLNRFTSLKEEKDTLSRFENGTVDVLVGTHRILSDDVKPSKLGLLVVDEEQRFGVKHKEKIKEMKNDVNVLTLSATPIPRTLKMALSGLRDLSIIDTPPINRYPVQTYVIAENELIIKDAIYKELSRNGQIFVLYNKVEDIDMIANRIKMLVPEARVCFAHGKMNKDDLENVMQEFVSYKYDILVSTTIIENGIDIPNANTLIVYNADYFGLSQLYQIRGRVGRSDRIGYAYLFYNDKKELNDIAVKRLQAIKEFSELGSGYKIAMRDLSIRGSGDIFGSDQAGFVDSVGISLYMKMVEDELKRLKGEEVVDEEDEEALIHVSTHIQDEYVSDEDIKIEIHQKINEIDSYEKLLEIKEELEDRFGKIDDSLEIYMYEEWFSKLSKSLNITQIVKTERSIEITLPEELTNTIKGDKLLLETMSISNKFNMKYINKKISIILYYKSLDKHYIYYLVKLLLVIKDN